MRRILTGVLLTAACSGAHASAAQVVDLGLTGGRITDERGQARGGITLSPSLTWAGEAAALRLFGSGTLFQEGVLGAAGARLGVEAVRRGPLRVTLFGEAAAVGSDAGYRALQGTLAPRLQLRADGWGVEAGPIWSGGGERSGGGGWASPGGLPLGGSRPPEAMRWRAQRGVAAAGWGGRGPLTLHGQWRAWDLEGERWQEWTGGAELASEVGRLGLTIGRRTGAVRESWLAGSASVGLGARAELVVEAGAHPSEPLTGRAAGRFASAGVRLRVGTRAGVGAPPAPPAPGKDGRIRLGVRAEPGARVELLGDWTGWEPRPVRETAPGWYSTEVALPPGTHRFLFRVDGEWRVPEGFATEPDGFGGTRAVVRVR